MSFPSEGRERQRPAVKKSVRRERVSLVLIIGVAADHFSIVLYSNDRGPRGAGHIDSLEYSIAIKETVHETVCVGVIAGDLAFVVDPGGPRSSRLRDIDPVELAVFQREAAEPMGGE